MGIDPSRLRDAVDVSPQATDIERVPERIASELCTLLGVAGAGLSVHGDMRVPLAASDPESGVAERLQFTLGDGPCLAAARDLSSVSYGESSLRERFADFHRGLARSTPFRAVAVVPVAKPTELARQGVLDCYSAGTQMRPDLVDDMQAVAGTITELLGRALATAAPSRRRHAGWLGGEPARRRRDVWLAAGLLSVEVRTTVPEATERLRATAVRNGLDLDELAAMVLAGDIDASHVTVAAPSSPRGTPPSRRRHD